jgi:HD superfamily phosphohydrolase
MRRIILIFTIIILFNSYAKAQELNARVTVVSDRIGTTVNKNVFVTLQKALNTFLNTRKWTQDAFSTNEKIECNFLLNLAPGTETNTYTASLTVQAARPVFNSSYVSPIINFKDDDIIFKYVEFQQLDFNENNVSGTDPLASNLTAVFAYYANVILGFDYLSFAPNGGTLFFTKAQNIINNAPDGRGISGWKAFDGIRNRYWLVENILNSRYALMQDVYYRYYRLVLDKMYEDENAARAELVNILNLLNNFNTDNPNTMINQFFFQGKTTELIQIFSKATAPDKARALEILTKLDLTNAAQYKAQLQ